MCGRNLSAILGLFFLVSASRPCLWYNTGSSLYLEGYQVLYTLFGISANQTHSNLNNYIDDIYIKMPLEEIDAWYLR